MLRWAAPLSMIKNDFSWLFVLFFRLCCLLCLCQAWWQEEACAFFSSCNCIVSIPMAGILKLIFRIAFLHSLVCLPFSFLLTCGLHFYSPMCLLVWNNELGQLLGLLYSHQSYIWIQLFLVDHVRNGQSVEALECLFSSFSSLSILSLSREHPFVGICLICVFD